MKPLRRPASSILRSVAAAQTRRPARYPVWLLQGAAVAALLALVAGSAMGEEYDLGPQDKLRINIVEWAFDDVRSPLTGEFTIGADGNLSLPLIGQVPAAGMTSAALADDISQRLQTKLGLASPPSAAVEVASFRPFYVLGDVDRPGEYAYRPEMTVLKALSLAGGLPRAGQGPIEMERAALDARRELQAATSGIHALSARLARLEAEIAGADAIAFPADLTARSGQSQIDDVLLAETTVFDARREAFAAQDREQAELSALAEEEVRSLREHATALGTQFAAVQSLLDDVRSLKAKGLSAPSRELDLERVAADVLGRQLDVEARIVQARQQHTRLREQARQARLEREQQFGDQLRETRASLDEMHLRRATAENLARLTGDFLSAGAPIAFSVLRREAGDDMSQRIAASHDTAIKPGDVVEVRLGGTTAPAVAEVPEPSGDAVMSELSVAAGTSDDGATPIDEAN